MKGMDRAQFIDSHRRERAQHRRERRRIQRERAADWLGRNLLAFFLGAAAAFLALAAALRSSH